MDEEKVRALVRAEIQTAFHVAHEDAVSKTGYGSGELESSAAYVVMSATKAVVGSLEPCQHMYRSCEDAQGNGGASCTLCYEREPEPANPFAPQRSAEEWAAEIRSLLEQAQNDGHEVWLDADRDVPPDTNFRIRVGSDDTASVVWETNL